MITPEIQNTNRQLLIDRDRQKLQGENQCLRAELGRLLEANKTLRAQCYEAEAELAKQIVICLRVADELRASLEDDVAILSRRRIYELMKELAK